MDDAPVHGCEMHPDYQYPEKESNNQRKALENRTSRQLPTQIPTHFHDALPTDPELARVIEVWPTLPEPLRRAMLAMIGSVKPSTEV